MAFCLITSCINFPINRINHYFYLYMNYLSVSPLVYIYIYMNFRISAYLSTCLLLYKSACLLCLHVNFSTCLPVCLSTYLPVYLSICSLLYPPTLLSAYLFTCLPDFLPYSLLNYQSIYDL